MVRHFRKTDTLARLCSIDAGVLINPSTDVSARRVRSSTRQTRILKNQAKLDSLMAELEQIKAYEKVCVSNLTFFISYFMLKLHFII